MNKNISAILVYFLLAALSQGCSSFDADRQLTRAQHDHYLRQLAPYVHKKPDRIKFEERLSDDARPYYAAVISETKSHISLFHKDSVQFFSFVYRDHTSLFEHYRAMGGYFKTNQDDSVVFVNLLYHTPRLTSEEMDQRNDQLFHEMTSAGHVDRFIGNRDYVHTPNKDFYYNVALNRWDFTENSSWKFLQEEQQRADSLTSHITN